MVSGLANSIVVNKRAQQLEENLIITWIQYVRFPEGGRLGRVG